MKNLMMTILVLAFTFVSYRASAQTTWAKYSGNPIVVNGSPGTWDQFGVLALGILFDSSTYHMWYTGIGTGGVQLGYATSLNKTLWTKHPSNPVLATGPVGSWDQGGPGSPSVLKDGSTYRMWYDAGDSSGNTRIGYATSPDRVTWTKYGGNPVLGTGTPGQWDDEAVFTPAVIFRAGTYHMWYGGWDSTNTRIGYATSLDGINWTKFAGNPVLDVGLSGSWDSAAVVGPSVVFDGSTYHMWYEGGSVMSTVVRGVPDNGRIGYATSTDGIGWTKHVGNPVVNLGAQGAWDDRSIFGEVIQEGSKYHMWYSGFGGNPLKWRIGYAVDSTTATAVAAANLEIPMKFSLDQNYPNPFNPSTIIRYNLARSSKVHLTVLNLLGQAVSDLVDEEQEAGIYESQWNATTLPSGVYFYRLEAVPSSGPTNNFLQIRKMILLR